MSAVIDSEERQLVLTFLNDPEVNLPRRIRQVLEMRYCDCLTYREITTCMNLRSEHARQVVSYTLRSIKKGEKRFPFRSERHAAFWMDGE